MLETLINEEGKAKVGAVNLVNRLVSSGAPFVIFTHDAIKTREQLTKQLCELGFEVSEDCFYTTSMGACDQIARVYNQKKVGYIGGKGLRQAIIDAGFEIVEKNADWLIIGSDHNSGYSDYAYAMNLLNDGASIMCVDHRKFETSSRGSLIGASAVSAMYSVASGKPVTFSDFPETMTLNNVLLYLHARKDLTVLISENLKEQIIPAKETGLATIWVSNKLLEEDIFESEVRPDYVIDDLSGLFRS